MKKAFVVTEGIYSDYHIKAVFTKKELALSFCDKFGGEIEEFELNPNKHTERVSYTILMKRNGDIERVLVNNDHEDALYIWPKKDGFTVILYANTLGQAVKVANERRVMMVAEGRL